MKTFYLSILAILVFTACTGKRWFEGGTLHKARVTEWTSASQENKMATCADMLVAIRQANGFTYGHTNEVKKDAEKLVKCIDDKVKAGVADTTKVSALAVECVVSFNSNETKQ